MFKIITKLFSKQRTDNFYVSILFFFSLIIGTFFLFSSQVSVENGFNDYVVWAESIVENSNIKGVYTGMYIRDVGMSLLLIFSGYTITKSIVPLLIIQYLMSLLIPVIIYYTINNLNKFLAFIASLISIISLFPFLFMKSLHHDLPYVFLMMSANLAICKYFFHTNNIFLYIFTINVFFLSLIRQVGKGVYPVFLIIIFLFNYKKSKIHIFLSILIFILLNYSYSVYRENSLGKMPLIGKQLYENLYFNQSDYGFYLNEFNHSSNNTIFNKLQNCLNPSPIQSSHLSSREPNDKKFMNDNYYIYSKEELLNKIYLMPNFSYLHFIQGCIELDPNSDQLYLNAFLEVLLNKPDYILFYTFRNLFDFLFDPGWHHSKNSMDSRSREGLLYPLGGVTTGGRDNIGDTLSERARKESRYIPFADSEYFLKDAYFLIENIWSKYYRKFNFILGVLIIINLLFYFLLYFLYIINRKRHLYRLLKMNLKYSLSSQIFLFVNIFVTSLFVETYYRYDFSLTGLKIIISIISINLFIKIYNLCRNK